MVPGIARRLPLLLAVVGLAGTAAARQEVVDVELQPLAAATGRVVQALDLLGVPLPPEDRAAFEAACNAVDEARGVAAIQELLDRHCLAFVHINPESRVKASEGPAPKRLAQHGWRAFLIKVHNEGAVTAPLKVKSPNAEPLGVFSTDAVDPEPGPTTAELRERFLDIQSFDRQPLRPGLSGLAVEYRIVSLHSRDAGRREATLTFDVGQGTQDVGYRSEIPLLFECSPAVDVEFEVLDELGEPTLAHFVVRDEQGRICPAQMRRSPPDFVFQPQVYRTSGETLRLAPGDYEVVWGRGPEYLEGRRTIRVRPGDPVVETFRLERWIDASAHGWWSGDHHIHAAGCSHYEAPTQGVGPAEILRHIVGEDLKVGCVLSWGPCWTYQKTFFDGEVSELSLERNVMRYDVEVSGFPSSHAGHLALLRLREDDYPGTSSIDEWPSWDLPVLQWARSQGAVAGFSHTGTGLFVWTSELPNYLMPGFNSIGANEYIVDVTHDAVDFLAMCNTPIISELNIWYHALNCGFRTRIAGETDFPCIFDERVGMGRSYVRLDVPEGQPLDFDAWVTALNQGRAYVGDGRSHILEFQVEGVELGTPGPTGVLSEVALDAPGTVRITARVAARLNEEPNSFLLERPLYNKPYYHLERVRLADSRRVPLEVVVNGQSVRREDVLADGSVREVSFEVPIERSSWVALRIFTSSHTNPMFVLVDGEPVRASRRSAQWCLDGVDACWRAKSVAIRESELAAAEAAYEHAREVYRRVLEECEVD